MKTVGAVILSLVLYLGILAYFGHLDLDEVNFSTSDLVRQFIVVVVPYLGLFLVMFVGIFFSSAFRIIKAGPERVDHFWRVIGQALRSQSFILGALVSPIVFGVVASQLDTKSNMLVASLFSFQNGFFWESIFKKVSGDGS